MAKFETALMEITEGFAEFGEEFKAIAFSKINNYLSQQIEEVTAEIATPQVLTEFSPRQENKSNNFNRGNDTEKSGNCFEKEKRANKYSKLPDISGTRSIVPTSIKILCRSKTSY